MLFYVLYRIGSALALALPRPVCYAVARKVADLYAWCCRRDREGVRQNLERIRGTGQVSQAQVLEVFRNFAMYLVDFFRFSRLSQESLRDWVKLEGVEHMQEALRAGKGAIGLTAHLGNFEMAGAVLALLGFPVHAVVLTHRNPRVNAFFDRQRAKAGVAAVPLQGMDRRTFFETGLSVLRSNRILALVADRDFTNHGLTLPLFGETLQVPTGPAAFSLRTEAPIVPGFLVREQDGRYRFVLEKPIFPPAGANRQEAVRQLSQSCLEVMARYIRQYPTQWYLFHAFWKPGPTLIL